MTLMRFVVLGVVSCGLIVGCEGSTTTRPLQNATTPRRHAEATPTLDQQLTAYVESIGRNAGEARKFTGMVLVAQGDRVLYERGFGFADREARTPITRDTSFRIGSITKQFTATAILMLEARGKLAVTDPISKYLPAYPRPGAAITIHQLLTHTSGIPNYTELQEFAPQRNRQLDAKHLLAMFSSLPLEFEPGSKWRYSNSNYAVLGAIIEAVAKQPYPQFMQDAIFGPAGLTRTVVGDAEQAGNRANGYQVIDDELVAAEPIDMSLPFAAGAIRSTAHDLRTWHHVLQTDRILDRAHRDRLYTPDKNKYGYGWIIDKIEGERLIWHNGAIDGFHAALYRVVDRDLVAIVLSNSFEGPAEQVAKAAITAALGKPVLPLDDQAPAELDPVIAKQVAGRYRLGAAGREMLEGVGVTGKRLEAIETITIQAKHNAIEMKPVGQPPAELPATMRGVFAAPRFGVTVRFDIDKPGPANGMHLEQGGLTLDYERAP
ncbi:MAG: serine hydrolase domain-containing protein [Kofleriaceae bacterium]